MQGLSSLGLGASVIRIFVSAIDDAPELFKHAKEIFEEIASKDDGLVKVTKIAAAFAAMAGHAANAGHVAASDGAAKPIEVLRPELRPTVQDAPLKEPEKVEEAAKAPSLDPGKLEAAAQTEAPPMGAMPQDSPVSGPMPARVAQAAPAGTGSPGAEAGPPVAAGGFATDPQGRPLDAHGNPVEDAAEAEARQRAYDPQPAAPVAAPAEVLGPGPAVAAPAGGSGQLGPTVTIRGHQYPVDAQGNVILNAADRLTLEQDDKPL